MGDNCLVASLHNLACKSNPKHGETPDGPKSPPIPSEQEKKPTPRHMY